MMSVRDRLERKKQTDAVEVKLNDDAGEIILHFKKLSVKEQERMSYILSAGMVEIDADTTKTATEKQEAKDKLNEEGCQILGNASIDEPKLDAEFWREKSDFSYGDYLTILTKLTVDSSTPDRKYMEEINKFLSK